MQIVTARLCLDALRKEDAAALFEYRTDPVVARYQGWKPASVAEVAGFIETQRAIAPDTPGTWWQRAIRLRETGGLIGDLGLHFLDDATVELGISLAPAHHKQGYAREAVEVMLDFVLGGLHKQRVVALVDPHNSAGIRLLEGLGLHRADAQTAPVLFAMKAGEWLAAPTDDTDSR
ncbi:MAG: GNAT family N-acetyltransferase [Rhodanobacteraceae bacterium]